MATALESLEGLQAAKRFLQELFRQHSQIHAVLFYGAEGSGKSTLARSLTQYWLCSTPTQDGGCCECKACLAFSRGNSTDVLVIEPAGKSALIPVGAMVRGKVNKETDPPVPLNEFFRTGPMIGRTKVAVIEDADRMNAAAYNALLKTLEEPGEKFKLILTTVNISMIPATIRSRCVLVSCELPNLGGRSDVVSVAAQGSPGYMEELRLIEDLLVELQAFVDELAVAPAAAALAKADQLRDWCDRLENRRKQGARLSNAEGLRHLSVFLSRDLRFAREHVQLLAEGHRRIVGNGNMGLVSDWLFAEILARN